MEGGLEDLVSKRVTQLDPRAAGVSVGMVRVADDTDGVVVLSVAVDHEPAIPRHPCHEAEQVEVVAVLELGRPFEDEDHRVGGSQVERVIEAGPMVRWAIKRDRMAERTRDARVRGDVLGTAAVVDDPVDERQPHEDLTC